MESPLQHCPQRLDGIGEVRMILRRRCGRKKAGDDSVTELVALEWEALDCKHGPELRS